MKKTIKTGLMIALFIVCIFLLLPFVITERTHEQKDEQLRTAQPQVYSSNPLTAFFQRAKDLLASHHTHKDSADAKSKAARTARAAQKHQNKDKNNPNNVLAAQRAEQTGNGQGSNGYSSNYIPKNYDFALYQSVAKDGAAPAARTAAHNSLFLADTHEDTPSRNGARNFTLSKNKVLASAKKSASSFPIGYSLGGVGTTAGALGVNAARNASYGNSSSSTDTSKILQDIARMRADARFPNPQTDAERAAREEFLKKEMERNQRALDKLYWDSVLHPKHSQGPQDPQDPQDQPDMEDFEKDVLGQIIVDRTGSNTIKSLNFVSDSATEKEQGQEQSAQAQQQDPQEVEQIKQDILQEQLAKNGLNLQDLSKEEQDFLLQDIPVIVTLGTTTEKTWEDVTRELERLEQKQKQQQADKGTQTDEAAQEGQENEEQGENDDEQQNSLPYKDFLEQFLDLYEKADCAHVQCTWYAATPPDGVDTLKDTEQSASYGGVTLTTDPLKRYQKFFEETVADAMTSTLAQPATKGPRGRFKDILQQANIVGEATVKFVRYANAIPYTNEDNQEVNKTILAKNKNEDGQPESADSAQTGPTPKIFTPNAFHAQTLMEDGISNEDMLTPSQSLEMLTSPEQVAAEGFMQGKINHILYNRQKEHFITEQFNESFGETMQQKFKNNPAPNVK